MIIYIYIYNDQISKINLRHENLNGISYVYSVSNKSQKGGTIYHTV